MSAIPFSARLRHLLITSRWQSWLFPVLCLAPYLAILLWMFAKGLIWVAQVLLAPVVMGAVLGGMTWYLAEAEFKGPRRR